MPDGPPANEWDFLAIVSSWNQYGLPALLVLVALALSFLRRSRRACVFESRPFVGAARVVALIHLGLGLRAGIKLAQELLTLREQGIPQSFLVTGTIIPALIMLANLAIGHGLWRIQPWAWIASIGWNAIVGIIAGLVAGWKWWFQVAFRGDEWPDDLVAIGLPWCLLVMLSLPAARALFRGSRTVTAMAGDSTPGNNGCRPWPAFLTLVLLLVVVWSTLAVDALDWLVRSLSQVET